MSLINSDDDQRWVPTHVQVTVLRGRGLRAKGKHGTSDVYTIIQVGKEKFTTCVVEKTTAPEWKEECSFELLPGVLEAEGKSAYPSGSSELVLTVMHRALIGLDVFLGQAIIALDKVFQERICMRNEWYKLNSKSGKKEKERGEVQVTVQFTRNNLTASMYDLSAKDKPISAFGRLKDRMKGRKREDAESASAVVPSAFGTQPRRRARLPSDGGGEEEYEDDEGGEGRRSKMRNFFLRGKLRKSSDTRSSTSLGSESSESSSRGGSLSPTAGISVVVSDLSNSPSETSNLTADNSPEHTTHPSPKLTTHKRAFSDEVGHITDEAPPPAQPRAVQSLKAQSGVLSQSSLCVNGSHVYTNPAALPANTHTLGLLQKCSPLSRSLQNLPRRADDPVRPPPGAEGRRWSFDKAGREERAAILEPVPALADLPVITMEMAEPAVVEGKKQKRNLFSHGRGDVVGKGAEQSQALPPNEEKHKGWFGSKDSHNKPSLEVSPKVETSSDAVPSHPLTPSPDNHSCTSPASATGLGSPGLAHHANPFTPPPDTPTISPSNPFFTRLQCNPFFVDLLGDHTLKSAPPAPCLSSSPIWPPTVSSSWSDPSPAQDCLEAEPGLAVGVVRERSQLGVLGTGARVSPNPFFTSTVSENPSEWDESFEAFAASRLGSQTGSAPPAHTMILPLEPTKEQMSEGSRMIDEMGTEMVSPTLLRRPTKIPVFQGHQSQRFDWTQEPGLNKDLFPPQIDMMSWEHSKKELSGHAPIHSQEDKTGISLFSEWDPEKPLDYSVSSPQFVNMSSLIPQSTSAGQPITSPFSKDYGETLGSDVGRDGVGTPAEQENGSPASALLFRSPEGVRGENDVTWNAPPVFGEEAMYKTTSSPEEVASEVSEILTYEPEVSLVETNPFFTTVPLHKFSEILLEVPESTTTDTLKPMHDAATEQMSTNTNVDLPEVTTHAAHENLHESDAHIFDFTSSLLPNTDAASSLSFTIADNTEINNNSTNELATSHSPFVPEVIMSEMNSEKPDSLFSDELEYSSPADVADLPIKADGPLSVSNEGFLFQSDMSIKAAELLPEESIPMALVEAPAGSPVQVDQEDELEKDGPDREETCAEEAIEKEQSHASTKAQETISQKLDMVLLADTTSDSTLEAGTITLDTQGSDSDLITLGTDSESAHQENCEENADLNVKDSNSPSAEINGCTLSDYLEAREPDPPVSPVPDALNFVTAIEDPDPGNGWESHDASQLKDDACETSLLEEGGFAPSLFVTADSSTAANESVQLEEPHNNSNESLLPPPKPPRLFQDSVLNEEHMNEYPHPGSGDEAEFKHLDTPKDSPSDLLQTPEVNSGPELQLTSPSPFPSDYSLFSTAPKVEWEKQNRTFTFMEDELSSRKVPQSSFSAFDLEENSDQSWVTSKSFFKELDTTHFAVWSADEENAILTDSTFLDKAILMEDSTQKEPLPDARTQPTTSTGSCSPSQKLNEELGESFLDLLKGTKQQTWTESVEPTWQSLPSLSELCSTVSQDPVRDLAPEDLLQPSKPFSGFDIVSLPKGIESTIEPKEELPAEVASTLRSHPSIGVNPKSSLFLHDCNPQASSTPSLLAETNAQVAFFPSPILPLLPSRPTTGTTSIAPPSKPPAMIDTPFMLLPQETQSADGLPSGQQSSPHPVKPLTSAAPQEEKKSEGRSVLVSGLEKLKSTIHPGRAAQQGEPEADRNKALSEGVAPYYHLSHNELVALLLQREAELERQGAEFERQGALLEKREVELKKMKHQTRDLEDYIDTLLVRIMEQTPTLLQVRSKLK